MDCKAYLKKHGRQKTDEMARRAGTSGQYFYLLASGVRNPSPTLALALSRASKNELDILQMLYGDEAEDIRKVVRRKPK